MTNHPLAGLPAQLVSIGGALAQLLFDRYRDQFVRSLIQARAVSPTVAALFHDRSPAEPQLTRFVALALNSDCVGVVTLACLNGRWPLDWARFEGLRPVLARIASSYAAAHPHYREFATLPRERLTDFFNRYAASSAPFGLLNEETRFQGIRLCAHVSPGSPPHLLRSYLDQVLLPLWEFSHVCSGVANDLAAQVRRELDHAARRS